MSQRQVLHILGTARAEGASVARIVCALARGFDPATYAIYAWFLGPVGPLVFELEAAGAIVQVLDWRGSARDPRGAWHFTRLLMAHEFGLIHQHQGGRLVRYLASHMTGAPLVAHVHGGESKSPRESTAPLFVKGADRIITTSHAVATRVIGANKAVVYPGVDIRDGAAVYSLKKVGETGPIIGTARRLIPAKGIRYMLRAAAGLLRSGFPGLRVEIAGSGPEYAVLAEEVARLGLRGSVEFLGWQSDLYSVLRRWDIFVLPSLEEGFGVAALEAMAAGVPVVGTTVGGIPELVVDGVTGWLVAPGDTEALEDRLRLLLENPDQRRLMGDAARARARGRFSTDRMVADVAAIYEDLFTSEPRSGPKCRSGAIKRATSFLSSHQT